MQSYAVGAEIVAKSQHSWSEEEILAEQPGGPPWRDGDGAAAPLADYWTLRLLYDCPA